MSLWYRVQIMALPVANHRPHGLFSHWSGPPAPSSSELTDLLLSPVSVPDSRLLQQLVSKPLILLDGYSGLVIASDFALTYAPTQYACTPVPPAAGTQAYTHTSTQYRELLTKEHSQKWS